jgi:hypothetical protein
MLNVGIIGDIKLMEPHISHIRQNQDVQIVGKSSIGTHVQSDKFRFTIPEFNRVELIDRSDVLLINNFSILRFSVLCDIVKKSKHIFTTVYPDLSIEECSQLVKLTNEAKTIFQFINPFIYLPAIRWLAKNIIFPACIEISFFNNQPDNDLLKLISMLKGITGIDTRKTGAVSYKESQKGSEFTNIHFQFGDGTIANLNYGKSEESEFVIKSYADNQFVALNLNSESFYINGSPIDLKPFLPVNELDIFIERASGKSLEATNIEDYRSILEAVQEIDKKLSKFSGA